MRHTEKNKTEMKTSREAFEFLQENCESTDRNIFEKKGVGIYKRKFHWAGSKEIFPLSRLAEVDTVVGSDSMHMFYDTGHRMHILVREIACFSCEECQKMNWRCCKKLRMCGPTMAKEVKMKSSHRVIAPLTRNAVVVEAQKLAQDVCVDSILGVECASEQEPYIVLKAVSKVYEYTGEDEYTWMGWIRAGDMLIDTIKFDRYGASDAFWTLNEQKRFPIFEEDLRTIIVGYETLEVRQSARTSGPPPPMRMEVAGAEVVKLQQRVIFDLNSTIKKRDRGKYKRQASA